MNQISNNQKKATMATLILGVAITAGGCSTKKYVRTTVDVKAAELSARMDTSDGHIQSNGSQIEELNSVAREHTNQIGRLDSEIKECGRQNPASHECWTNSPRHSK